MTRLAKDVEEAIRPVLEIEQAGFQVSCQSSQCLMEPELVKSLILNLVDNGKRHWMQQAN